jgi:hypothetical protein
MVPPAGVLAMASRSDPGSWSLRLVTVLGSQRGSRASNRSRQRGRGAEAPRRPRWAGHAMQVSHGRSERRAIVKFLPQGGTLPNSRRPYGW